jgi:hypothetical protein
VTPQLWLNESIFENDAVRLEPMYESVGGEKTMFLEGPYAQSEVVNKNRRNYPFGVLAPAVEEYVRDYVNTNRAIGELNHPDHPKPNPERASHLITRLTMEGNDAIGKSKVIHKVPCGRILHSLVEAGVNMGVSTRGLGAFTTDRKTGVDRVTKYKMFAIDAVADPSAPHAFVKGIMEGAESLYEDGLVERVLLDEATRAKRLDIDSRVAAFAGLMSRLAAL